MAYIYNQPDGRNVTVSASRENAPLVELIAELRWDVAPSQVMQLGVGSGSTFISASTSAIESFFMRMGAAAQRLSHTETERLIPGGLPIVQHQPVYRFKRSEDDQPRTLYQVGPGMFSANAVPPYESWASFEPVVRAGVDALLNNRIPEERETPFSAISLRYIDAFGSYHREGKDVGRFIAEVLGLSLSIPAALSQHLHPDSVIKPIIQLQIPMRDGFVMSVGVGEGTVSSQAAIILDTTVATTLPVPARLDTVMEMYGVAHDAIDSSFSGLVEPIDHLMPRRAE